MIFQAGSSDDGIVFAGRHADAVFTDAGTLEDGRAFYRRVKERAAKEGRNPEEVKIFPVSVRSSGRRWRRLETNMIRWGIC